MTGNLFSILRAHFPHDPATPAILDASGPALSYGDLLAATARLAATLVRLGLRPGDRLAAQVEKSVEALLLYLATVRAGGVFLPLNTAYIPAELAYLLGDAEPRLVVVRPGEEDAIAAVAGEARMLTLGADGLGTLTEAAAGAVPTFEDVPRERDDLAAILYTSGTTGRSKGAMLSSWNLASNAFVLRDLWRFTSADVLLHALPIYHTHGLFTGVNTLLVAGGTILHLPRFEPDAVLAALPRATAMMGVPTFYTRLLADPRLSAESTRHMRVFISGSAPLLAETHAAFAARTGHAILERYGMTETSMLASNPYDRPRRAGTVGFPLPEVELRVADPETGAILPAGEIGSIEVRGPNVFKGYWRQPERTAAEHRADGFFVTGDLGLIDEEGYLRIVGRAKDLVITGGLNVYPKEIEEALDALPGVLESAVIGLPHADLGEAVTAVLVPRPGALIDEETIQAALAGSLARFKQPRRVVLLEALPRNAMGKVQKAALRERWADLYRA